MDTAIKIEALQEFCERQQQRDALQAHHAAGMLQGLKRSLEPDYDHDDALTDASFELQHLLESETASPAAIERATGYISGLIFAETNDIVAAKIAGYQEREALLKMLETGQLSA